MKNYRLDIIIGLLAAIFIVLLVELVIKPSVQPVRWDIPISVKDVDNE